MVLAVWVVMAWASPHARGQAGPVPLPLAAPTYDSFNVDASSKVVIHYTIGPFANNRFPVTNGQPSKDSTIVINATTLLGMPKTATAYLNFTIGQAGVQFDPAIAVKGLKWDQGKGQFTATNDQLADLATKLVDAINGMLGGFDANNLIPSITVKLKLGLDDRMDDKSAPDVDGYVTVVFKPVVVNTAPANPVDPVGQAQAVSAKQQADTAQEQAIIAKQQADIAQDQATITQQQQESLRQQADTAREQATAAGNPEPPALVLRQQRDAARQIAVAQKQVEVATQQVEVSARQVAVAVKEVANAQSQLASAVQQFASASAAQKTVAQQQALVAQQQAEVAQRQADVAMKQNAVAQAQSVTASQQAARAAQQAAAAH